jgi:hypothetical protein
VPRERRFIKLDVGSSQAASAKWSAAQEAAPAHSSGVLSRVIAARTSQELLDTTVDALTAFGRQVVFLALEGTNLTGWGARGLIGDSGQLLRVSLNAGASPLVRSVLGSRSPVALASLDDPVLRPALHDLLFVDCDERLVVMPLVVADRPFGIFVLARLEPKRTPDPSLLAELMQRIAWRMQALHLMECVCAPLSGCP